VGLSLLRPAANRIYVAILPLSRLPRHCRGERAVASLTGADTAKAIARVRCSFTGTLLRVSISSGVIDRAVGLAQIYGLRGYDAVQLAAAVEADELNVAAAAAGLQVENPNAHP
jgi:uncharacterized protein